MEEGKDRPYEPYLNILENAPYGILLLSSTGQIEYANPMMSVISGLTREQLLTYNVFQVETYIQLGLVEKIKKVFSGERFFVGPVKFNFPPSGKTTIRNFTGVPLETVQGKKSLLFVEDVTELNKAVDALKDSHEFLDKIINSIADPIFVKDRQHRMVLVNDAECALTGHKREEVIGKTDREFFPKEQVDLFFKNDEAVFETGKENISEERLTDAKGATHVIVTKKTLYTDKAGNKFLVGVIRDITERKQAEDALKAAYDKLKETQVQLVQSEKLQTIGTLASGMAHEVKNPLAIITQAVDYLECKIDKDDPQIKLVLSGMKEAVLRADRIIMGLLDFSSAYGLSIKLENLDSVIERALFFVEHELFRHKIKAVRDYRADMVPVALDSNKMIQVFINLFLNAVSAMPEGGEIRIRTYSPNPEEVCVEILDTGSGIPHEALDKVFDPFYTTHRSTGGTGLGLSVVKNIVELHKGSVTLCNRQDGPGAKATLRLKIKGGL